MTQKTADLLTAARALIADPTHWCAGHYAKRADHTNTDVSDPKATCFCMLGAIARASGGPIPSVLAGYKNPAYDEAANLCDRIAAELHGEDFHAAAVNDEIGHEAALTLLDTAIKRATASQER